jgi:AhpD family alkylhydroperoxidase
MQARMKNPVMVLPGAMEALQAFGKLLEKGGVPRRTLEMVHLRVSQINGCSVCVDMSAHSDKLDKALFLVSAWREAPYFTDAERAALALSEAVTRLSDRPDPVPDEIWNEATKYYDERQLSALILYIALTNVWNRVNATTRQVAGEWLKSAAGKEWAEKQAVSA